MSGFRLSVCVVVDGSYLYVVGGRDEEGNFLKIVERFDFRNNIWKELFFIVIKRLFVFGIVIG